MAASRSARRGDRHLRWQHWLLAYGLAWLAVLLIGLVLILPLLSYPLLGEEPGSIPPILDALSDLTPYGAVILHIIVMKAWVFLPSLPVFWLAMRAGLGGWINFAFLGLGYGSLLVVMIDGMPLDISAGIGLVGALVLRVMLGYERPEAFITAPR